MDRSATSTAADAFAVLVPDAHAIGMIGVIRALGGAGYVVHACASDAGALGLQSRMAAHAHVCPPYGDPHFIPWLRGIIASQAIGAIVHSEGFLLAIQDHFDEFAGLLPIPGQQSLVYDCLSKTAVLGRLLTNPEASRHLPPSLLISSSDARPTVDQLEALGHPLFVKADGADDREGQQNIVSRMDDAASAAQLIEDLLHRYRRVLVQGFVPGIGTGAYVLIRNGRIVQQFMNRCLHEVPHTGGFCSLRDSWWHERMMEDARIKIAHLGWEGVAMLEYRWDPATDQFWFVELNARFWAALHVALYAGVNFPVMLLDGFRGRDVRAVVDPPLGIQVRYTIPFEIGYVASRLKDPAVPLTSRAASVLGFFARFLSPMIRADLLYPGDRALYFKQWWRYLKGLRSRGS